MTRFEYIGQHKINYKGNQYHNGDVLELNGFDYDLPRDLFVELKEESSSVFKRLETVEKKKTKKKEV